MPKLFHATLLSSMFSSLLMAACIMLPLSPLRAQNVAETSDSASERVVRAFLDAYAKRDLPAMGKHVADDISWMTAGIDSIVRPYFRGKVAFDSSLRTVFNQPVDGVVSLKSVTTVGPWLAAHWRSERKGPNGTSTTMSLMVFEVRRGQIRRIWQYPPWNHSSFQLPGAP
ncbi:nuclear transport factor 2 family protein [Gemmatimonas sp.]|uniref:nuclear transport factor 2 family protein n=1 Tax=Gemmatimonas sp. TaxID=1962908 RepID=UPI00286E0DB6|nr:nuclear transport factor 2 family protein [Gemmatimonas sp.]